MPSLLAWLDHSEDDQRRMRELIALFAQEESRDELGIGAIRDAFSNRLFPGTSVIQTRARYFLFVPWIFREGARQGLSGAALRDWGEVRERRLIMALKRGGDEAGLIGRVAGVGVKLLPSTIYWTGLQVFGITRHPGSLDQALRHAVTDGIDEADEIVERRSSIWHPTIPQPLPGFFSFQSTTFALTPDEAEWLMERIAEGAGSSMLGYIVSNKVRPLAGTAAPWEDPLVDRMPSELVAVVEHARMFSLVIQGAGLVYNLLLARRANQLGYNSGDWADQYEDALSSWWDEASRDQGLAQWDRRAFWDIVTAGDGSVPPVTMRWVNAWLDRVANGTAGNAARDVTVQALVADRERLLKGVKARLVNDRLLANWRGASGTGRLVYRWGIVLTELLDLFDGLERARP